MTRPRRATYRLQLTPDLDFDRAASLVEPLGRLGVSHLYLSPIAQAVPSSQHGYDVVDHRRVRAEFGGADGLRALLDVAEAADLGVIVDHVPNHVSIERPDLNPHWWAMLRDGPDSRAADWFDVDWAAADGKVIVPRLGEPLDVLVERGDIVNVEGEAGHEVRYGPLRFPVRPGTGSLDITELLEAQHYRLSWWCDPERNVRRFFTIDDLAAVRVELHHVREMVDTVLRELCDHPTFDGVRIDHVDGLADPATYLQQLRGLVGDRWILVEKILGPGEQLPDDWPVDGTTGYEFVVSAEHALVDVGSRHVFDGFRRRLADERRDHAPGGDSYHGVEDAARREVLDDGLRPDVDRLLRVASCVAADDSAPTPDTAAMRAAVVELTVGLDRYRTYLPGDPASQSVLDELIERVRGRRPDLTAAIDWFVRRLGDDAETLARWQQLTGPAMAKGAEDRAFFRHLVLAGWNEVGGRPDEWGHDVDAFHRHQERVQRISPETLLVSTTHDTKRSSGVRARSLALAELADPFIGEAQSWIDHHATLAARLRSSDLVSALQTAVTAWPIDADRLHRFLVKSAREADLATTWTEPDSDYESALHEAAIELCTTLDDTTSALRAIADDAAHRGAAIGDAVAALHLTCPGVPDLYQGMPRELLTLVDPDNRTEPDWDDWRALLDRAAGRIDQPTAPIDDTDLGRTVLVMRLLDLRRRRPNCFGTDATYRPFTVDGPTGGRIIAYERAAATVDSDRIVVVVAPGGVDVSEALLTLPSGRWRSVTGDTGRKFEAAVDLPDLLGTGRAAVVEPVD